MCGSYEERKKSLNSHFSDAYKKLLEKINQIIGYIQSIKNIKIDNDFDLYEDLKEQASIIKKGLDNEIIDYNNYLSEVIKLLEEKRNDIFNTNLKVGYREFSLDIAELNSLINNHNEKVGNFEKEKQKSAHKVITVKILEMENSPFYKDIEENIKINSENLKSIDQSIQKLSGLIASKTTEVQELEKEIHSLQIGAEKFNQYLDELLPSLGLEVETFGDSFTLKRNGFLVKNLSEGEKNILSFIYFVLSFSNGNKKSDLLKDNLKNWIVFIDDPMSSLDDSNLHLVAGFIKKHFMHAKQIFIATHNFAFWRCLRNKKAGDNYLHYLIEKKKENSEILKLENKHVLVKHQSDYTFIYQKLKEFVEDPSIEENVAILNHLRKFLEYFVSFMYPNNADLNKILTKILGDELKLSDDIEKYITYSMMNDGSHMQTRTDFISKNCEDVKENIEKVLNAMENKYPDHIDSLNFKLELSQPKTTNQTTTKCKP